MTGRSVAVALVLAAVPAVAAAGCSIDPVGVEGTVTARFPRHDPATHAEDYYLTIGTRDYRVDYATYAVCFRGSYYPACKHR